MGRPRKADVERKTSVLRIRMTSEDRRLLDVAARSSGLSTSSWARNTLLRSAKRKATTITPEWTRKSVHGKHLESKTE